MQLSYRVERAIPALATVLRGFDESAYMLELNGKEISRSSWDVHVAGFAGFDLGKAPFRSTLELEMLKDDDTAISSPAMKSEAAECRVWCHHST